MDTLVPVRCGWHRDYQIRSDHGGRFLRPDRKNFFFVDTYLTLVSSKQTSNLFPSFWAINRVLLISLGPIPFICPLIIFLFPRKKKLHTSDSIPASCEYSELTSGYYLRLSTRNRRRGRKKRQKKRVVTKKKE